MALFAYLHQFRSMFVAVYQWFYVETGAYVYQ